jgi:hypothetical protein
MSIDEACSFSTADPEVSRRSLYVGSPETVATKLAVAIRTLGLRRFDLVNGLGAVPHEHKMATIKLYGCEVILRVRELLGAAFEDRDAT